MSDNRESAKDSDVFIEALRELLLSRRYFYSSVPLSKCLDVIKKFLDAVNAELFAEQQETVGADDFLPKLVEIIQNKFSPEEIGQLEKKLEPIVCHAKVGDGKAAYAVTTFYAACVYVRSSRNEAASPHPENPSKKNPPGMIANLLRMLIQWATQFLHIFYSIPKESFRFFSQTAKRRWSAAVELSGPQSVDLR